jgi:hypothetical protein
MNKLKQFMLTKISSYNLEYGASGGQVGDIEQVSI